jgi:endonuclease YncB( thermonuclease family)
MKLLIAVLILAMILVAGCTQNNSNNQTNLPKACTEEAKICPDGSAVGRIPPNCDFAPCPQTSICKGTARCFNGTVTKITDGDTLEVNNTSVRLALVDAPEYNEEGGSEATEFASSICSIGSTAKVDEDDGQTAGSYGRIVAVVYCDGRNLNAELLANGKATVYEEFCNVSEFANESWVKRYGC